MPEEGIDPLLQLEIQESQSPYFSMFMEPRNRFQGMKSASLFSLAGRYDNPIPTRFLAPVDCLKIPAQASIFWSVGPHKWNILLPSGLFYSSFALSGPFLFRIIMVLPRNGGFCNRCVIKQLKSVFVIFSKMQH